MQFLFPFSKIPTGNQTNFEFKKCAIMYLLGVSQAVAESFFIKCLKTEKNKNKSFHATK